MMTRSTWINKATPLPFQIRFHRTHIWKIRTGYGPIHEWVTNTAMIHAITISATRSDLRHEAKRVTTYPIGRPPRLAGQPEMLDNNPFIWQLIFAIDTHPHSFRIRRTILDGVTVTDGRTWECLHIYFATHECIHSRRSNNEVTHWPELEPKGITDVPPMEHEWKRPAALIKLKNENEFHSFHFGAMVLVVNVQLISINSYLPHHHHHPSTFSLAFMHANVCVCVTKAAIAINCGWML